MVHLAATIIIADVALITIAKTVKPAARPLAPGLPRPAVPSEPAQQKTG